MKKEIKKLSLNRNVIAQLNTVKGGHQIYEAPTTNPGLDATCLPQQESPTKPISAAISAAANSAVTAATAAGIN